MKNKVPAILLESRHLGSLLEGYRFIDRLSVGCPSVPVATMITESNMRVKVERAADGQDLSSIWSGVWVPGVPVRGLQIHRKTLGGGGWGVPFPSQELKMEKEAAACGINLSSPYPKA